jgi:hypothetical protein
MSRLARQTSHVGGFHPTKMMATSENSRTMLPD